MKSKVFRKIFIAVLCLCAVSVLFACGDKTGTSNGTDGNDSPTVYTVTFVQDGKVVKTVEVESGAAVAESDIPTPAQTTGYTTAWEEKDLSAVTANVTVNAVKTAKKYNITFGVTDDITATVKLPEAKEVTYGSEYTLPSFSLSGYTFNGWIFKGAPIAMSGIWQTDAENIKLVADLTEKENTFVVKFVNSYFGTSAEFHVEKDTVFSERIPAVAERTGYDGAWDENAGRLSSAVTENITINAVYTPKTFKIYFDLKDGSFSAEDLRALEYDSEKEKYYLAAEYDAPFTLATPTKEFYTLVGWMITGSSDYITAGIFTEVNDIYAEAEWRSINDDGNWTPEY